jgi:hypothetical protein
MTRTTSFYGPTLSIDTLFHDIPMKLPVLRCKIKIAPKSVAPKSEAPKSGAPKSCPPMRLIQQMEQKQIEPD